MRAIMGIVDKLDIRRAQVLVEAVLVEVNMDKTSDIGVNWGRLVSGSQRNPDSGRRLYRAGRRDLDTRCCDHRQRRLDRKHDHEHQLIDRHDTWDR